MFRFVKNASAALALSGLVLAQPAFATRSSDSLPSAGAKVSSAAVRLGSPVGRTQNAFARVPVWGWVLGAFVIVGFVLIVTDDNNEAKSPG